MADLSFAPAAPLAQRVQERRLARRWRRLMGPNRRFVVACSGGPDSQALLLWTAAWARRLGLVHLGAVGIDHGLRPAAAQELAQAASLCARLELPFVALHVAQLGPGNLLAAARRARRVRLLAAAQRLGAQAILLAHTQDDQAETVLQRLAQGTGLGGAAAMAARSGPTEPSAGGPLWLRPWLAVSRADILAYLMAHGVAYATDPSNACLRRSRAVLRQQVLPPLLAHYPAARRQLANFAALAQSEHALLSRLARRRLARCCSAQDPGSRLAASGLVQAPAALRPRMAALWLAQAGLLPSRRKVRAVLAAARQAHQTSRGGGQASAGTACALDGRLLCWQGPQLFFRPAPPRRVPGAHRAAEAPTRAAPVPLLAGRSYRQGTWSIHVSEICGAQQAPGHALRWAAAQGRDGACVAFAAEGPHVELSMRSWRPGDRLRPFGGNGSTAISDLFVNAKVPRSLRAAWPVILWQGEPAWVVGLRRGCQAPLYGASRRWWILRAEPIEGACSFTELC